MRTQTTPPSPQPSCDHMHARTTHKHTPGAALKCLFVLTANFSPRPSRRRKSAGLFSIFLTFWVKTSLLLLAGLYNAGYLWFEYTFRSTITQSSPRIVCMHEKIQHMGGESRILLHGTRHMMELPHINPFHPSGNWTICFIIMLDVMVCLLNKGKD